MTTDAIKHQIFSALYVGDLAILRRYNAPEHLSANRQKSEIEFMVTDIASEITGGIDAATLAKVLEGMHQHIRKNCRSRSWPSVAQFIAAVQWAVKEETGELVNTQRGIGAAHEFNTDDIMARRINSGQPVAESFIYGSGCVRLLASGEVTQFQIDQYREGMFKKDVEVYKQEGAEKLRDEREKRHAEFL